MQEQDGRAERVVKQSRALGEDVRGLARELSDAAKEVREKVDFSASVREHPFRAVLVAAGVGYVLGGGLFSPLTGRLMRIGTRALLLPMVTRQFESMVGGENRTA